MKYLILASLIAVLLLCAAQVARTQDTPPGYRRVYSGERLDGVKAEPHIIQPLIEQYEAECYADSTWTEEHSRGREPWHQMIPDHRTPCWYDTEVMYQPNNQKCVRPGHWKKYWKHREPTYQGFKEFIKRRMR